MKKTKNVASSCATKKISKEKNYTPFGGKNGCRMEDNSVCGECTATDCRSNPDYISAKSAK